jgi:tetratricopeptide (TPR) repeat protein/tRNA A-37 threonylcarbamoyl transferase component Bud32
MTNASVRDDISLESLVAQVVDEFRERQKQGEQPTVEEYATRYPQAAELLRNILTSLELLGASLAEGAVAATAPIDGPLTGTLGDFRILREVGRGGMGLVYEAEQISLGRRVALKVLPFAAAMDAKQLQRFKNEAQAAAHLHHQNIVPVHYVGCERGVHFYAMQYIEGQTLSTAIEQLRLKSAPASGARLSLEETKPYHGADAPRSPAATPSAHTVPIAGVSTANSTKDPAYFRSVAQLGIQAAEALDYAHLMGVIHRDVKPGNLMVDATGRLWVTDFGLAQMQSDTRLTMTGDLVGTLRYMSPEQALAKRVVVDHRTDIYSLGTTLYELLTLQPAYSGNDRQELLRQIAFEEPKPPRRLNRAIPAELETIVLKAMEKNPAERYATAQDLADDLRRVLNHETIRARRASLVQRARKWTRRHKPAVAGAMATVIVALLVFAGSLGWYLRDRDARLTLIEKEVEVALEDVERLRGEGKWPEAATVARRAEGLLVSGGGNQALRERVKNLATDLEMVARLEEIRLEQASVIDGHFAVEAAGPKYAKAFRDYGIDVQALGAAEAAELIGAKSVSAELVGALDDWARFLQWIDREAASHLLAISRAANPSAWRTQIGDASRRGDKMALGELTDSADVNGLPTQSLILLASVLKSKGMGERAVELLRRVQRERPGDFWVNHDLAWELSKLRPPRWDEAIHYYSIAVALRPKSPGAFVNLGHALYHFKRLPEAEVAFRKAIVLKGDYAELYPALGRILCEQGRLQEAEEACRQAMAVQSDCTSAYVNLCWFLRRRGKLREAVDIGLEGIKLSRKDARIFHNLGLALADQGKLSEAADALRQAIALQSKDGRLHSELCCILVKHGKPDEAERAGREAVRLDKDYARAHKNLGDALEAKGLLDQAILEHREAIRLRKDYAEAHHKLAVLLKAKGKLDQAILEYREAIRLNRYDSQAHFNFGNALREKGQLDEAIAEYREAIRLARAAIQMGFGDTLRDTRQVDDAIDGWPAPHQVQSVLLDALVNLGATLIRKGQLDEAVGACREAIRVKEDDAEAHCNLGHALREQGRFADALAALKHGHELGLQNPRWPYPSAQWVKQGERLVELDAKLPRVLKGELQPANLGERLALAELCQRPCKALYAAAARLYAEAIAAQPPPTDRPVVQRYNVARAAALAGCGQGKDADQTDVKERVRLRRQAQEWLRTDLAAWRRFLEKEPDKARPVVRQQMQHWQQDKDFAGVRGAEALAQLPAGERQDWQKLWGEVEELAKRAVPPQPELIPLPTAVGD